VPRNIDYDAWVEKKRRLDPNFERRVAESERVTGPKRKVPLLLDQNIESEIVDTLRSLRAYFRVHRLPDGADDDRLWSEARRAKLLLVTADGSDFWRDHTFPIHESPGLVVLKGRTATDKSMAMGRAFANLGIIPIYRREGPGVLDGLKARCGPDGGTARWFQHGEVVTFTI
jgi:predicted nuclease of predicted toxin-antitoxin system